MTIFHLVKIWPTAVSEQSSILLMVYMESLFWGYVILFWLTLARNKNINSNKANSKTFEKQKLISNCYFSVNKWENFAA